MILKGLHTGDFVICYEQTLGDFVIGVHEMQEITLKRKIYTELQKWKKEYAPEYALFIKGARRVGKTTIAEELGKNEYKSYITINFQSANDTIRDLFVNSLLDLDYFYESNDDGFFQLLTDDYISMLACKLRNIREQIQVLTIALSPECCRNWDNSLHALNIFMETFEGRPFSFPEDYQ